MREAPVPHFRFARICGEDLRRHGRDWAALPHRSGGGGSSLSVAGPPDTLSLVGVLRRRTPSSANDLLGGFLEEAKSGELPAR